MLDEPTIVAAKDVADIATLHVVISGIDNAAVAGVQATAFINMSILIAKANAPQLITIGINLNGGKIPCPIAIPLAYQKVLAISVFILENLHEQAHDVEAPTFHEFIIVFIDFRHPSPLVVPIALYMSCSNGRRFHQASNQEEILLFNY